MVLFGIRSFVKFQRWAEVGTWDAINLILHKYGHFKYMAMAKKKECQRENQNWSWVMSHGGYSNNKKMILKKWE